MPRAMRVWLGFSALWVAIPAHAAPTFTGVVSQDHEHGAPVGNVEIFASGAGGANPATSGNDGLFILTFPNGHPGQDISIRVKRSGWDVVNYIQLDQRLPDITSDRRLEVIICARADWQRHVEEFYHLKVSQSVEQFYQIKLAELKGQLKANLQERDRLVHERDAALALAHSWAQQLAFANPSYIIGDTRRALQLFLDGKADEALKLLGEDTLHREEAQALEPFVQKRLLKARILISTFDYAGASRAYEDATIAIPQSYELWFDYARFLDKQNQRVLARHGYEQALKLARQASDRVEVAEALRWLGVLSADEHRGEEARKESQEALDIFQDLARQRPDDFLPKVAKVLSDLGLLFRDEHHYSEARKRMEEAIAALSTVTNKHPDELQLELAALLHNFALINSDEHRNTEARKSFEEVVDICRKQGNGRADDFTLLLGRSLFNLGSLNSDNFIERGVEARNQLEEALHIFRSLADKNPAAFRPDLARTLQNLGNLSLAMQRSGGAQAPQPPVARQQIEEAVDIFRALASASPNVYQSELAQALGALAVVNRREHRFSEARDQLEEKLEILRSLAVQNPDVYLPKVAGAFSSLDTLSEEAGHMAEARTYVVSRLDILRPLAHKNPDAFLPDVAQALYDLAQLDHKARHIAEAYAEMMEALAIFRKFAKKTDDFELRVALTLAGLAIFSEEDHRHTDAVPYAREALQVFQRRSDKAPLVYQPLIQNLAHLLGETR